MIFMKRGVIDPQQYSTLVKDSGNLIRVVTGKQAVSVPINKTYSTIGAYEHLFMDPTLGPKRSNTTTVQLERLY